jgi:hypothetical protein
MTIVVEIRPEVQAEIARLAALQGRAVEAHAATLLEEAVHLAPASQSVFDLERAQAAGARIRELSRGLSLGGLTIRALIDEGRR